MCGRLVISEPDLSVFVAPFHVQEVDVETWQPRYNLAPSQLAPLITNEPKRRLTLARFGLIPSWAKDAKVSNRLINARVEGVARSKVFRHALSAQRGIVPANGYFEWTATPQGKRPVFIHDDRGSPLALAALWENWRSPDGAWVRSFAVITRPAIGFVADIHSRMPFALRPQDVEPWLASGAQPSDALLRILDVPADVGHLVGRQVSALANSPRNDGPECIAEAATTPAAEAERRQLELFETIHAQPRAHQMRGTR